MEEHDIDPDLSSWGPAAIPQDGSGLLLIETRSEDVDVSGLMGELLPENQREGSRMAQLPSTSQSRRWVLETYHTQALSALLALAPLLQRDYSISVLPEAHMGYAERTQARRIASITDWGIGAPSAVTGSISPTVFGGSSFTTSPATTTTNNAIESDEDVGEVTPEQSSNVQTQADTPPPAQSPVPQEPELDQDTISIYENLLIAHGSQLYGGMLPSHGHLEVVAQHEGRDEDELGDDELEVYARMVGNLVEAGIDPSSGGSARLAETGKELTGVSPFEEPSSEK